MVTAVVCAAFDPATDAAIDEVRALARAAGARVAADPAHRPHLTLTAARVPSTAVDAIVAVAATVAARHPPIPQLFTEVGRFSRSGALWLGPAPTRELEALHRDAYRSLPQAGYPPAFGVESEPRNWVAHCTLATRVPRADLPDLQAAVAAAYTPIRGSITALAVILVGGRGDVAVCPLAHSH